jgi:hypothetical protein
MSCDEKTYKYKLSDHSAGSVIASKRFEVSGKGKRAITQFLQVDLGSEFAFSANLAVVIK